MREEFGDIWEMGKRPNSVVCITTNGYVNARGECVMGRGVAKQAKQRYPGIARTLGNLLKGKGNHVHKLAQKGVGRLDMLMSFPTKHVWWRPSDLLLIAQSAQELKKEAERYSTLAFYLPRPGCSNGGLKWADVKPVLESVGLPDNVVVVTNDAEQWEQAQFDRIYEEASNAT